MPLKLKTVKGVVTLTWSSPTMEASWKIRPTMTEAEMMDTLCRVVIFVNSQNRELGKMEYELLGTPSDGAVTTTAPEQAGASTPPVGRIQMLPPSAVGDRPSDGGPPQGGIDFTSMPTTTVPEALQATWDIMPPEEMTW
jgi:hypothetical protein